MTPSIAHDTNNNMDLNVAGPTSAESESAPALSQQDHESVGDKQELGQSPTVEDGNSLMFPGGSESVSTEGLFIVTSDYETADESETTAEHVSPYCSPLSRPPSEAGYSVCSSSADVPYPEEAEIQPPILMMPPHIWNQGMMPIAGMVPIQMYHNGPTVQQPQPPGGMMFPSPPPAHQQYIPPTFQSPVPQMMPPQQGISQMTGVPPQAEFQSPGPMYQQPHPVVSPVDFVPNPEAAAMPVDSAAENTRINVATMPMPTVGGQGGEMSVGTRNGPMVLFATAPGASESTIEVPGVSTYPECVSQQMEIVWHGEFNRNFCGLPHQWRLQPTDEPPASEGRWKTFKDSAKVRFMCNSCGNAWTSMKGRVMFWIHLDPADNLGGVLFKLYGQACNKCGSDDEPAFCPSMWYPEEVVKVVGNLYNRVGQLYYGFNAPSLRIDRRSGRPRDHHNAKRCQACKDGVCKFEWVFT